MKKLLLPLSVLTNVALLAALLWMYDHSGKSAALLAEAAMNGDELHMKIHARSLSALESADAVEVEETKAVLQTLVRAGESSAVSREALRKAIDQAR